MYLNLACGDYYVKEGWKNIDYATNNVDIDYANLLRRLPYMDEYFEGAYCSHFVEHIALDKLDLFLREVKRVLKKGAVFRIVVPDLDVLCRLYMEANSFTDKRYKEFITLELIDQCVRRHAGGELSKFYSRLDTYSKDNDEMIEYIKYVNGDEIKRNQPKRRSKSRERLLRQGKNKMKELWCKLMVKLLPSPYKSQMNIGVSPGEQHCWIYNYEKLEGVLLNVGFTKIMKMEYNSSLLPDFPYFPLDMDSNGLPRKGVGSMYVEAIKS